MRRKSKHKLQISRFDDKNGLYLFDPLTLNYIHLKYENDSMSFKCKILHGK